MDIGWQDQEVISLPRRELFDIRAQLMAEDTSFEGPSVVGLSTDDIMPRIYEGGFKTWECSVDLARYLTGRADITESVRCQQLHVIEARVTLIFCYSDLLPSDKTCFYYKLMVTNISLVRARHYRASSS